MSATLEWRMLRHTDLVALDALPKFDSASVNAIVLEADSQSAHPILTQPLVRTNSQKFVLLDMVFHLLRFGRSTLRLTHAKQSAMVSILLELHRACMTEHLTAAAAYARFEELLLVHSVQRPPHGVAIFRLDESRALAEYCTATYFRYYTLYLHAFTHRRELTVTTSLLGDGAVETLPAVPPLCGATPQAVYEANEEEKRRILEAAALREREAQEEREHLEAEERRIKAEAEDAARREVPQGLRSQLLAVKHQVGRASGEHLNALEAKLAALESKVAAETLVMPGSGAASSTRRGAADSSGGGRRGRK